MTLIRKQKKPLRSILEDNTALGGLAAVNQNNHFFLEIIYRPSEVRNGVYHFSPMH